jgi:hypothetical protein
MAYELRIPGAAATRFETEHEAVAAACAAMQGEPDLVPEIIDLATGRAAAPGASQKWREELRSRVGF